jgi:hypothetical protein
MNTKYYDDIDFWEIAEKNYIDYYCVSNGKLVIWKDGTGSIIYGDYYGENALFSLLTADSGYELERDDVESEKEYYIENLFFELENLAEYFKSIER